VAGGALRGLARVAKKLNGLILYLSYVRRRRDVTVEKSISFFSFPFGGPSMYIHTYLAPWPFFSITMLWTLVAVFFSRMLLWSKKTGHDNFSFFLSSKNRFLLDKQ
jgi:hypothetical protein